MQISPTMDDYRDTDTVVKTATTLSEVSWGAIFAGGAAAVALSLLLMFLGTGLGLSTVSPWAHDGISGKTFTVTTIVWITFISLAASALGGYIAGRLRTRRLNTQPREIHFRDFAHGFLAWAVATLATASLLTSVITSIVSGGAQAGAAAIGSVATTVGVAGAASVGAVTTGADQPQADSDKSLPYFMDTLFRRDPTAVATAAPNAAGIASNPETDFKAEITNIYVNALSDGSLSPEDVNYAGQLVARTTGISQADAEKRVTESFNMLQTKLQNAENAAREAADKARKASVYGSFWLFISLLLGAFTSSVSANYGGRHRDR